MATQEKVKSSIYLTNDLHQRATAFKQTKGLSFNTICTLALEEYLQQAENKMASFSINKKQA